MRTTFLLTIILMLSFEASICAQKLKDKRTKFYCVELPTERLPDDYLTYSVRVYGSAANAANLSKEKLARSIQMDGFKRINGIGSNYGHLRIDVNTGYVNAGEAQYKSKTNTKKDKNGKETKTYSYWYEIPYRGVTSYRVVDPAGNILASDEDPYTRKLSTRKYSKSSDLSKNYSAQRNRLRRKFAKDMSEKAVSNAQRVISKQFDFKLTNHSHNIYSLKKHSLASDFDKYLKLTGSVFSALGKNYSIESVEETKRQMQPALDFWKEEGAREPNGDKKLKTIYKAANYNLAVVSFYLDDLEAAEAYAQNVLRSEGKDRRSKLLLKDIAKAKEKMAMHDIQTMHYITDLSNAVGPTQVKELAYEEEAMKEENNSADAVVVMDGKEIRGSILQTKGETEMMFGKNGNTTFVSKDNGRTNEYDLTDEKITSFSIADRQFIKTRFSPSAKGESEASLHILEVVYDSEKIKLLKYYPSTGAMGDEKTEFAFQKSSDEFPISLYSTPFLLWKKGIAKYFSDCSDLNEMCASGDIKMEKDDLIKAARIYSELCE